MYESPWAGPENLHFHTVPGWGTVPMARAATFRSKETGPKLSNLTEKHTGILSSNQILISKADKSGATVVAVKGEIGAQPQMLFLPS